MEVKNVNVYVCTPWINKIKRRGNKGSALWTLFGFVALAVFIVQFSRLLMQYHQQDPVISSEISTEDPEFPWVTVCSDEPMDPLVVHKIDYFMKGGRVPKIPNVEYEPQGDYITKIMNSLNMLNEVMGPEMMNKLNHKEVRQVLKMVKHFSVAAMLDIDIETVKKFAVKREDFIVSCSFRGSKENCNITEDFKYWLDPLYGICYTYMNPHKVIESGPRNGLSLILNTRAGKNVFFPTGSSADPVTGSSGVHVTIHEPMTMPIPQVDRIDLSPGISTSVGLQLKMTRRLSDCGNELEIIDGTEYKIPLSQCQSICKQKQLVKHCGCHDSFSPHLRNAKHCAALAFGDDVRATCYNDTSVKKLKCASALQKWGARIVCPYEILGDPSFQMSVKKNCKCQPPCTEVKYNWQTSYMQWPTDEVMVGYTGIWLPIFFELFRSDDSIKQQMDPENWAYYEHMYFNFSSYNPPKSEQLEALSSFVRVNIYFTDTNVLITKEVQLYSLIQLVSDLSAQLSFWLGLSIFSFLETLERFILKLKKRHENKRRKEQGTIEEETDQKDQKEPKMRTVPSDLRLL